MDCDAKSESSPEREAADDDAKGMEGTEGVKKRKRKPYRPGAASSDSAPTQSKKNRVARASLTIDRMKRSFSASSELRRGCLSERTELFECALRVTDSLGWICDTSP